MRDDVNDEVPNEITKILIPFDEVLNWDGMLKLSGMKKGNHITHFKSWIEKLISQSLVYKCSYVNDIIKVGPMI